MVIYLFYLTTSYFYNLNTYFFFYTVDELPDNIICINQILVILLIVLWILIQIIIIASCFIVIRKYKRLAEIEDDRSSLQKIHQHLDFENRRVRWADQGQPRVLMLS